MNKFKILLFLIVVFIISFTVLPLYQDTSDQNLYFTFGLAKAGAGYLANDWFSSTPSPYPIFDQIIILTKNLGAMFFTYFYQIIFMMLYFFALTEIPVKIFKIKRTSLAYFMSSSVLIFMHCLPINKILESANLLSFKVFFQGVGGQYLINQFFQPSSFDALLLFSIYLFLVNRPYLAVASIAVATTFHISIILISISLTIAYLLIIYLKEKDLVKISKIGLTALLLNAPIVLLMLVRMHALTAPPDITAEAMKVFSFFRAADHVLISQWFFQFSGILKISLILLSLWICRNSRLKHIILIPFCIGLVFTFLQVVLKSNLLILILPWRVFALLVPLASSIIVFSLFEKRLNIKNPFLENTVQKILYICILSLIFLGLAHMRYMFPYPFDKHARFDILDYVKNNKSPNDLYVIPINEKKFRIYTEAPVFVDFKCFPLGAENGLEWYKRIKLVEAFYKAPSIESMNALKNIQSIYKITHVLIKDHKPKLDLEKVKLIYKNQRYSLYKLGVTY
ncbi:DUF6798 domain-containing protein [Candidatus Margulisiibacteriota bacterium]